VLLLAQGYSEYCSVTEPRISSPWPAREADGPREWLSLLDQETKYHLTSSPYRGHRAPKGGRSMSDTNPAKATLSRPLPERANLEHLRKEAKQRLKTMRLDDPGATLAAAQLATARQYGFASWRRLVAFVTALRDRGDQLRQAVHDGDICTATAILDDYPDLVNATMDIKSRDRRPSDTVAMSLLHVAIAANQIEMARLLLRRGADPNKRNADGRLPLHDCFELGRDEFKDILLEGGATPDVCAAAAYGLHDRLHEILQREPSLANDLSTGNSPLGWSVYGWQPESARILLAHGAILDRPPYDYKAWAPTAGVGSTKMARFLLEHGADPNCQDEDGDAPLHNVFQSRIVKDPTEFVELLMAFGADPDLRNNKGQRPLDIALAEIGSIAETYFPRMPRGSKNLEPAIDLLQKK
jgi:ankyrin repeat protein